MIRPHVLALSDPVLNDKIITCLSSLDWDEHWTSKQQIMSRLALDNRVVYVEPPRTLRHALRDRHHDHPFGLAPRPRRLRVRRPLLPLPGNDHSAIVRDVNARVLRRYVPRHSDVLWFYTPRSVELTAMIATKKVVYHCVDFHSEVAGDAGERLLARERRLVGCADVVFASSPALRDHCVELGARRAVFIPHGVDYERFASPPASPPQDWPFPGRSTVLICGTFDDRLDVALIAGLAERCPELGFVLVGLEKPTAQAQSLARYQNVRRLGPRPVAALPAYLHTADLGLIPYRINSLTRGIYPLKFHEYLAAGLPVVATPLPSLLGKPHVRIAADVEEGAAALMEELNGRTAEHEGERRAFAQANTWDAVLRRMLAELSL